jgi:hypothetical protein
METALDKGYRVSGAVVNLAVAGAAAAVAIFSVSNTITQIGTKSFKPRKLMVRNNAGGNCWLFLGLGSPVFTASTLPAVRVLNNMDNEWQEVDLPAVEHFADLTAYPDALVAGGSLDVKVEAEECG